MVREAEQGGLVSGALTLAKGLLGPLALVGAVAGSVAQSLRREPDQEIPEALQKLGEQLDVGSVALVLVGSAEEASAYTPQLEAMCGDIILHEVPQEVLEAMAAAVEAAEAQKEAEEKAAKEAEKAAKEAEKEAKKAEKEENESDG
jgi:hypothetical protein